MSISDLSPWIQVLFAFQVFGCVLGTVWFVYVGRCVMSEHYVKWCVGCGDLISQCRCPGPRDVRFGVCSLCFPGPLKHNANCWNYPHDGSKPTLKCTRREASDE